MTEIKINFGERIQISNSGPAGLQFNSKKHIYITRQDSFVYVKATHVDENLLPPGNNIHQNFE